MEWKRKVGENMSVLVYPVFKGNSRYACCKTEKMRNIEIIVKIDKHQLFKI